MPRQTTPSHPPSSAKASKSPLFMMAQLPFNRSETVALNTPMIAVMDDTGNLAVSKKNLTALGLWGRLLQPKVRFLEIGCGSGYLLEALYAEGGGEYFGLEPIESEYIKATARLAPYFKRRKLSRPQCAARLKLALLEQARFPKYSLDCIYSYHVFEHLENPLLMLSLARQWLKKNGKLIIVCPNVEGAVPQSNLAAWRCSLSSHRWLPGLSTIKRVLQEQGFLVEKFFTYGGHPAPRSPWQSLENYWFKLKRQGDVMCIMATTPSHA